MKGVGEPCAGEPHARFDGRGLETERYGVTAPAPDPTNLPSKTTGDGILLTHESVDALDPRPPGLIHRGFHALKGKSATVQVFGLDAEAASLS